MDINVNATAASAALKVGDRASIACRISARDGHVSGCKVVGYTNKSLVAVLLTTLANSDLRYRPMTLDGLAIDGVHVFRLEVQPTGQITFD